jgi:hypothetical protein
MIVCKVFTKNEVDKAFKEAGKKQTFIGYLIDNNIGFCSNTAIPWYVADPAVSVCTEDEAIINNFFLIQGCEVDEKVYIDISY